MTPRILAALLAVLVLGMWFNSTRPMSITAAAILTFMYPMLVILVVIGSALAAWHFYVRQRK